MEDIRPEASVLVGCCAPGEAQLNRQFRLQPLTGTRREHRSTAVHEKRINPHRIGAPAVDASSSAGLSRPAVWRVAISAEPRSRRSVSSRSASWITHVAGAWVKLDHLAVARDDAITPLALPDEITAVDEMLA
jgi:hypothetical protein